MCVRQLKEFRSSCSPTEEPIVDSGQPTTDCARLKGTLCANKINGNAIDASASQLVVNVDKVTDKSHERATLVCKSLFSIIA